MLVRREDRIMRETRDRRQMRTKCVRKCRGKTHQCVCELTKPVNSDTSDLNALIRGDFIYCHTSMGTQVCM